MQSDQVQTMRTGKVQWFNPVMGHGYIEPSDGGTDVLVTLTRVGKGFRGKLVGALIPIAGARTLGKQFQAVLRRAEAR